MYNSFNLDLFLTSMVTGIAVFIPRLLVALMVFVIFKLVANYVASIIASIVKALNIKQAVNSFDLGLKISEDTSSGIARTMGLLAKYIVIYVGLIFAFQILGLNEVAQLLSSLVNTLPRIISAFVILLIGVVIAGFVESIVKKTLASFDPATARLGGKTASYTVISFFILMSLAELGLASTFINTLFMGLVAAVALAFGLSVGLGSKDLVNQILTNWYKRRKAAK